MDIRVVVGDVASFQGDALVVNLFEGVKAPGGATGAVDAAMGGTICKLIQAGEVKGKWGEQTLVHALGRLPVDRVLVMGLGKPEEFTLDRARIVAAEACKHLRKIGAKRIGSIIHGAGTQTGTRGFNAAQATQALVEGAFLGLYRFTRYKRDDEETKEIGGLTIIERDREKLRAMTEAVRRGRVVAEATNAARDLVNEPGNTLTPTELARRAVDDHVGIGIVVRGVPVDNDQLGAGFLGFQGNGGRGLDDQRGPDDDKKIAVPRPVKSLLGLLYGHGLAKGNRIGFQDPAAGIATGDLHPPEE